MRDAAGEAPHRFHLLTLPQLGFEQTFLGDVTSGDEAALQLAVVVVVRNERGFEIDLLAAGIAITTLTFERLALQRFAHVRTDRAVTSIADDVFDDASARVGQRRREELLEHSVRVQDALVAIRVRNEQRQRVEHRAVEILAAAQRLLGVDLRADVAERARQARRPTRKHRAPPRLASDTRQCFLCE